jgi:hypothetical protein
MLLLHWSHFLRRTGFHFAGKCSCCTGRISCGEPVSTSPGNALEPTFSRLTPLGGGMSSGTKKSICRRWVGSARYLSKSVTPSPARNVSSSRKLPVNVFGLLKIA